MNPLLSGLALTSGLAIAGAFIGSMPSRDGARASAGRRLVAALMLTVSLFAFAAIVAAPFVHAFPKAVTTIAERVLPHLPKGLHHPFRYPPSAEPSNLNVR